MALRDYFHLFSTVPEQSESYDYILHFLGTTLPDLRDYPDLTKICDWATYDDHSFRIWTRLPLDEFEQKFAQLTPLNERDYQIDYSYNFKDINFF
ncbi:hypothetical protein ACEN4A_08535 [Latilactobacillus sakei]|uniref:hypothetical protein n=1 Tax=Latilactobacillus sakei TaxID=1599 RepID=UPI003889A213